MGSAPSTPSLAFSVTEVEAEDKESRACSIPNFIQFISYEKEEEKGNFYPQFINQFQLNNKFQIFTMPGLGQLTEDPVWIKLVSAYKNSRESLDLRNLFQNDPQRFAKFRYITTVDIF